MNVLIGGDIKVREFLGKPYYCFRDIHNFLVGGTGYVLWAKKTLRLSSFSECIDFHRSRDNSGRNDIIQDQTFVSYEVARFATIAYDGENTKPLLAILDIHKESIDEE